MKLDDDAKSIIHPTGRGIQGLYEQCDEVALVSVYLWRLANRQPIQQLPAYLERQRSLLANRPIK